VDGIFPYLLLLQQLAAARPRCHLLPFYKNLAGILTNTSFPSDAIHPDQRLSFVL